MGTMGNPESWQLVQRSSSASPRLHSTALVVQRFVVPALSSESQSTTVSSKPGEALAFSSFTPYRHTLARVPSHPLTFTLCRWSGTSCRGAPALRPARRVPEHHLALQSWQLVQRTSSAFPRLHPFTPYRHTLAHVPTLTPSHLHTLPMVRYEL